MSAFRIGHKHLNSRRACAAFATWMVLAAGAVVCQAQTTPSANFQYSTITASGTTVIASDVPVVTSAGISYVNVVVQFDVATDGTLTITPGYPQIAPSARPSTRNFLAGNYVGPAGDPNFDITVFGPGITVGGATEWSLATSTGASCATTPTSATWYVFNGPMTQHPLATRLKAAGITTQTYNAYSWGTTGDQCNGGGQTWETNTLIGLSQISNSLMILSFTRNDADQTQPVDQITYSRTGK